MRCSPRNRVYYRWYLQCNPLQEGEHRGDDLGGSVEGNRSNRLNCPDDLFGRRSVKPSLLDRLSCEKGIAATLTQRSTHVSGVSSSPLRNTASKLNLHQKQGELRFAGVTSHFRVRDGQS